MHMPPASQYHDLTRPWQFRTPQGLVLRGRRADGPGATLHFIAGNGFCGGVYWPFLRPFLARHGLFCHDIEGHGESDAPAHYSGLRANLQRLRAVAEQEGLVGTPLIGMGHSFGGALTLQLAARHPGMFRALVLLDPILMPTPEWQFARLISALGRHPFSAAARRRRTAWPSRQDALAHLRGRGIYKGWSEEALACFVDHAMAPRNGEWVLRCPRELEAEIFDRPIYAWHAAQKIDCPVLFLRGAGSYPFFPRAEARFRRAQPQARIERIAGGHCFMQEDPQAAFERVEGFLASVPALGGAGSSGPGASRRRGEE